MLHTRVLREGCTGHIDTLRQRLVGFQRIQLFKQLQRGQRRAAGQRVAGVGVRMQKAPRHIVVVERGVHRIGGEHGRQRQCAACEAFGQANEIRPDSGLLVGEHGARAAKAHGDFVYHQVHLVAAAQRTCQAQVFGVVHRHAGRALHQGLDDEGCGGCVVFLQPCFQRGSCASGHVLRGLPRCRTACVRAGHGVGQAHQRGIGFAKDRNVGHGQRAHGFAVVATGQAHKAALGRAAGVAPVVRAHLQGDLGGGGTIAAVERVAQAGERGQALGQLHHGCVCEARQHHVV